MRLISRGRLKATRIPPDKWRILPDVFFACVSAGADDFRDLRNVRDVLTDNTDEFKASELASAVIREAENQRPSDSQAEVRARQRLSAGPNADDSTNSERSLVRGLVAPEVLYMSDPLPPTGSLTQHQAGMLFRVLDARYSRMKPT